MAKAIAKCTCERCGNVFEVTATKRNCREADSWVQWASKHYTVCDDCTFKEREEKAAELAEKAKKNGLPTLMGTPKQCVWAEEIRNDFISRINEMLDQAPRIRDTMDVAQRERLDNSVAACKKTKVYILQHMDKADWWIDNRGDGYVVAKNYYMMHKNEIEEEMQK